MKLSWLERIFAVTNQGYSKVICLLGVTIRFSGSLLCKFYRYLPIDNNKIVLSNFDGAGYGCNPKYITQEIIKRKLPYKLVWLVRNPGDEAELENFPKQIKLVNFFSLKALKELATAKVWIDNQRKVRFIKKGLLKRQNQYYIQTWHGSLGIKKLDANVSAFVSEENQAWVNYAKQDSAMMDFFLTNSDFELKVFKSAMWFNNEDKNYGHPRNDVFYKDNSEICKKVKDYYEISESDHILLYVPSFRDDGRLYCFGLEYDNLLDSLKEKFGGEWKILVRMHPRFVKFQQRLIPQNENIINVSEYPDIQELLVAADIAITDYSSCIFDFMLSRKPGFIYASDIKEYDNDRGFYYPLTSTPFPVAQHNEELRKNILNFNYESYREKVEEFLKDKGCMEDGHASERVVDLIEEIMSKGVK